MSQKCNQPDGPDGYHKICFNTDHDGKAVLSAMWKYYLAESGDNSSAAKMMSDDARVGARFRKFGEQPKNAVEMVSAAFPGTEVIE